MELFWGRNYNRVSQKRGEVVPSRYHGSKISGSHQTENVTQKVKLHCFKLHRSYSVSFICQMLGKFSGVKSERTASKFRKRKWKLLCYVFTFSFKPVREIRRFHVAVVQRRLRNVQKSVMHVQSCCFANKNLRLFIVLYFSVRPSRSSALRYGLASCISVKTT